MHRCTNYIGMKQQKATRHWLRFLLAPQAVVGHRPPAHVVARPRPWPRPPLGAPKKGARGRRPAGLAAAAARADRCDSDSCLLFSSRYLPPPPSRGADLRGLAWWQHLNCHYSSQGAASAVPLAQGLARSSDPWHGACLPRALPACAYCAASPWVHTSSTITGQDRHCRQPLRLHSPPPPPPKRPLVPVAALTAVRTGHPQEEEAFAAVVRRGAARGRCCSGQQVVLRAALEAGRPRRLCR